MQGDLISRGALIEALTGVEVAFHLDEHGTVSDNYDGTTIMDIIEEQPTAYSVEKVVEEMNKLLNEELHSVLKPLPDGTEYPEEAYRLLYLNTRLRGLIRNGGKE